MKPGVRFTPYVLVGILVLGTGVGIGLGLAESGTTAGPSGSTPLQSLSACTLVPAASVGALINERVVAQRLGHDCGYFPLPPPTTGPVPQLFVRASANANKVATARRLLDPKTKVVVLNRSRSLHVTFRPSGRHFVKIDGVPAVTTRLASTVTISAVREGVLLQVQVSGVTDSDGVADKMMAIALETLTRLNRV